MPCLSLQRLPVCEVGCLDDHGRRGCTNKINRFRTTFSVKVRSKRIASRHTEFWQLNLLLRLSIALCKYQNIEHPSLEPKTDKPAMTFIPRSGVQQVTYVRPSRKVPPSRSNGIHKRLDLRPQVEDSGTPGQDAVLHEFSPRRRGGPGGRWSCPTGRARHQRQSRRVRRWRSRTRSTPKTSLGRTAADLWGSFPTGTRTCERSFAARPSRPRARRQSSPTTPARLRSRIMSAPAFAVRAEAPSPRSARQVNDGDDVAGSAAGRGPDTRARTCS